MNVQELIDTLSKISNKDTQVYFDATTPGSPVFILKSIDIIEVVEDDMNHEMVVVSCGLEPPDERISLN